ncbi:MAG: hypothetical protein HZC28_11475 [Spirochaetes bacterium]|nr:hypothetical protein [Spirochaetota bacterium]
MTHDEIIIGHFEGRLFAWQGDYVRKILEHIVPIPVFTRSIAPENRDDLVKVASHIYTNSFSIDLHFHTTIIDAAIRSGEIDCAVVPLEILPEELPYPLTLAGVVGRVQHREVLISRDKVPFAKLPPGASVGVYSLRQVVQLKHIRGDLSYVIVPPDAETLLSVTGMKDLAAVVYPESDVKRLSYDALITETFSEEMILPALRQSAFGCVTHRENSAVISAMQHVTDAATLRTTRCEEGFMHDFNPPFDAPLAGRASVNGDELRFSVRSIDEITLRVFEDEYTSIGDTDAYAFGRECARRFEQKGGRTPIKRGKAG